MQQRLPGTLSSIAWPRRLQADWAARLRTTAERMSGSGHYVQRDRPDAVAEAIIAVAATARSQPVRTDTAATVSQ